jgi:hypothetical protein
MLPGTNRPSSPPPSWRRRCDTPTTWWVDLMLLGLMVTILGLIVNVLWGCSGTTAERAACSAVGVTLTSASEVIVDAMATDLVGADDESAKLAVEDEWAPVLACYETAAVAQNAWADALDRGESYDWAAVGVVYCDARACLASVVQMPDWPMGGCP